MKTHETINQFEKNKLIVLFIFPTKAFAYDCYAASNAGTVAPDNGTVCAIGGKGFCVIGGDSRLKRGYSILSRNQTKITKL